MDWLMHRREHSRLGESGPLGRFSVPPLVFGVLITDGDWHRIGFTWDGSTWYLYMDGNRVAEGADVGLAECYGGLNIGCGKGTTPNSFFTGLIDDVRIYNRAVKP